jgi:hypothetical protein
MLKPLFVRTSKTGSEFVMNALGGYVDSTLNVELLNSTLNLKIMNSHSNLFKFTLVRNPYDRAYSCWKYCTTTASLMMTTNLPNNYLLPPNLSFIDFLKSDFHKDFNMNSHTLTHIIPVSEYLGNAVEKMDYIIKIENIKNDITKVSKMIRFNINPNISVDPIHKTTYNISEKQQFLSDPKITNLINEKYENDFKIFGYNMK